MKGRAALAAVMLGVAGACLGANDTGNEILSRCGPVERHLRNESTPEDLYFDTAYCLGWINGVSDTIVMMEDVYEKEIFCGRNITTGQALSVFLKYLRENPAELNDPAARLVWLAYSQAWPCKERR